MTDKSIDRYISDHTTPEDPLLTELDRITHLRVVQARMVSGHVQGKVLEMISRMLRPRTILEIGTFTGYSALCLAKGLADGGILHTVEPDDELEAIARSFFDRSPDREKIKLHIGSALDIAPALDTRFDLVFIDGDKREYTRYYRMLMDNGLVGPGSYLLADNVIWYGKVTSPAAPNDRHTADIQAFNDMVQNDPRVENVILPLRDGMSLIRVR